jgi:hypothetical protein
MIMRMALNRSERGKIAGIRQLVDDEHLVVGVSEKISDQCRTNEARSTRDNDLHASIHSVSCINRIFRAGRNLGLGTQVFLTDFGQLLYAAAKPTQGVILRAFQRTGAPVSRPSCRTLCRRMGEKLAARSSNSDEFDSDSPRDIDRMGSPLAPRRSRVHFLSIRYRQRAQRMAVIFERAGEFLEQRESSILVGHDDIGVLERPCNSEIRVAPANPTIVHRRIKI